MSCTITLKFNNGQDIVLDGIDENSIQDFYNDYSKILSELNRRGKLDEFMTQFQLSGFDTTSAYQSKEITGLQDKEFFMPNMSYTTFRGKFPKAPQLSEDTLKNLNILYVDNLTINGHNAPKVFMTKDTHGNNIYVVQKGGEDRFINYLNKLELINSAEEIPRGFINFIQNQEQSNWDWLRAFSDFSYTKSSSQKSKSEYQGTIATAKQVLIRYLQDPESFYRYRLTSKDVTPKTFEDNVKAVRQIKTALNNLQDYTPPTNYASPFANALMLHTHTSSRGTYITVDYLKTLTKQVNKDLYDKYFGKDNLTALNIQKRVNAVLSQLFYKYNGQPNYETAHITVNSFSGNNIYLDIAHPTVKNRYNYTIKTIKDFPHQEASYKGWNIYSKDINGNTRYFTTRGIFTESTIGTSYPSLNSARAAIDSKYNSDKISTGLISDIYKYNQNRGEIFTVNSWNPYILPGQVIQAIDVQINSKYFIGVNSKPTYKEAIETIRNSTNLSEELIKDINTSEKAYLTLAKIEEINKEGKDMSELEEFIKEDLTKYKYYYVTNVFQSKGFTGQVTLREMSDIKSSQTAPKGYVSMHQRMWYFAEKIENRFGIPTRVMTSQDIINEFGEQAKNAKAFVHSNSNGEDEIVINSDIAHKSDLAHEYMHIFMGIVKSNPELQEDYQKLLEELISTDLGQEQLDKYSQIAEYSNLSQTDLFEEVAANIMGKYLSDDNQDNYPPIFDTFRRFLQVETFNQDISLNILNFTDNIKAVDTKYKIPSSSQGTERIITNYIKGAIANKIIIEEC